MILFVFHHMISALLEEGKYVTYTGHHFYPSIFKVVILIIAVVLGDGQESRYNV